METIYRIVILFDNGAIVDCKDCSDLAIGLDELAFDSPYELKVLWGDKFEHISVSRYPEYFFYSVDLLHVKQMSVIRSYKDGD